jgi:hypothetical protein
MFEVWSLNLRSELIVLFKTLDSSSYSTEDNL